MSHRVFSSFPRAAWVGLLFAVVTAGLLLSPKGVAASAPAPDRATARFEVDFMENMIDHHTLAIQMAQICVQKAIHPELRQMCQTIIETQSQERQQMQTWLQRWYGVGYQPQLKPGDQRMLERLAALSGAQFETEFMQMMIKHHQTAIREAEGCLRRAYHPELRHLCQNIITTQSAEIKQMQAWLCQWYDICQGRRRQPR